MTTPTDHLKLKMYDTITDASALFQTFREDLAGNSPMSNMSIIDSWAESVSGSIASIAEYSGINIISASYVSENFYASSASAISEYKKDMQITLILDKTNDGAVTLNINSLGTKALNKIDVNGNKINFTGKELVKNKPQSFVYDGLSWVWMGSSSGEQITVPGNSNNFTMISGCSILIDSGISSSSVLTKTSIISSSTIYATGEVGNFLVISSSGVITDSGISVYDVVSASIVAPSTGSYVVLGLNSDLHNEWLLTAGSNIIFTTNSAASTITIDTLVSASSVANSGSYVMLALHPNITGEWLLTAGENITIAENASASTVTIGTAVAASSIAPSTASYVLLGIDPNLQNGLVLTGGSNVTITRDTLSGTVKINSIPSSNSFFIDQTGGTGDTYGAISGLINGVNKTFTVSQGKYAGGSLEVYLNGQLQTQGALEDWEETSPANGTFTFLNAPVAGDLITAKYMVTVVTTANADTLDNYHASAFMLKGEDISSGSVAFIEAGTLLNINSGENLSVLFGKIKKLFTSFFTHAHTGTDGSSKISGSYLTGTVPVANGGTGETSIAAARNAFGLGNTTGAVPVANGGTSASTAGDARTALGLGSIATINTPVPVANGGTGATTVAAARNNFGLGNTTGALPVANGGTGATTSADARNNLGLGSIAIKDIYTQQVTLSSGSWVSKAQTVTVSNMTSSAIVQYGADPSTAANRDAFYNADVYCSAQAKNSLTFKYTSSASPTANIVVNIMFIV